MMECYPFIFRCSDGGVFLDTPMRQAIESGSLGFPQPVPLPDDDSPVPYSIVADDAFPLRTWLLKPYPQRGMSREERIFNYRLSRARRVVENAFGILANRFRFLHTILQQNTSSIESIVLAACVLHNLMRTRYPRLTNTLVDQEDSRTHDLIPGQWRTDESLLGLAHMRGNNMTRASKGQRDYLKTYYNGPGRVPWQDRMI